MTLGWCDSSRFGGLFAAAAVDTRSWWYYGGLAVVVLIVLGTLIAFYRTWEEIHEVEEPDSPADLLESFRKAHAEGELDAKEFDRVRSLLEAGGESGADVPSTRGPGDLDRPIESPAPPGRMPGRPGSRARGPRANEIWLCTSRGADLARRGRAAWRRYPDPEDSEVPLCPLGPSGRVDPDLRLADEGHELGDLGDRAKVGLDPVEAPLWHAPRDRGSGRPAAMHRSSPGCIPPGAGRPGSGP